jgi:hypothetical protein
MHHSDVDEISEPVRLKFFIDGFAVFVRKTGGADFVGAIQDDAARNAHVFHPQSRGFIDAVKNGKFLECVGMNGQFPAEFSGGTLLRCLR